MAKEKGAKLRRLFDDGDERNHDHFLRTSQTTRIGKKDTAVKKDEHEHGNDALSLVACLSQTPRTGVEDAGDEHTSSTVGKQPSPGM